MSKDGLFCLLVAGCALVAFLPFAIIIASAEPFQYITEDTTPGINSGFAVRTYPEPVGILAVVNGRHAAIIELVEADGEWVLEIHRKLPSLKVEVIGE